MWNGTYLSLEQNRKQKIIIFVMILFVINSCFFITKIEFIAVISQNESLCSRFTSF